MEVPLIYYKNFHSDYDSQTEEIAIEEFFVAKLSRSYKLVPLKSNMMTGKVAANYVDAQGWYLVYLASEWLFKMIHYHKCHWVDHVSQWVEAPEQYMFRGFHLEHRFNHVTFAYICPASNLLSPGKKACLTVKLSFSVFTFVFRWQMRSWWLPEQGVGNVIGWEYSRNTALCKEMGVVIKSSAWAPVQAVFTDRHLKTNVRFSVKKAELNS